MRAFCILLVLTKSRTQSKVEGSTSVFSEVRARGTKARRKCRDSRNERRLRPHPAQQPLAVRERCRRALSVSGPTDCRAFDGISHCQRGDHEEKHVFKCSERLATRMQ